MHVVFDGVAAFDSHKRGKFVFAMSALNVRDGKSHHHLIRMTRGLLIHGVNQIERVLCKMALIGFGIYPDGEELCPEIAALSFVEAEVANVMRIG